MFWYRVNFTSSVILPKGSRYTLLEKPDNTFMSGPRHHYLFSRQLHVTCMARAPLAIIKAEGHGAGGVGEGTHSGDVGRSDRSE